MKLSEVIPFLTLSAIADPSKIEEQFNSCHSSYHFRLPYWSIYATRRKLMISFWYTTVLKHFIILFGIGLFITALIGFNTGINSTFLLLFFCLFCSIFFVMLFFIYLPSFQGIFLPMLDSCLENYSGKQLEGIQKCKKEQYPVMTLMLIQYCYFKLAEARGSLLMDPFPGLLMKQYGVSQKMIDSTLRTIVLNNWDRAKPRKRTEVSEAFDEAIDYFQSFGLEKAVQILISLQRKVMSRPV